MQRMGEQESKRFVFDLNKKILSQEDFTEKKFIILALSKIIRAYYLILNRV